MVLLVSIISLETVLDACALSIYACSIV